MATWNSDNIILTKLGEQVLSKVQSGVGKLTVSRIVSGAGHVSPAQLYNQTQVTDIKQELTIAKCTTTESQSTISANLTNTGLEEAYDLYQIGIYVTHPDFTDGVLYLIAQCDSPDHIPLPGDNPVTLSYDLVMAHSGTKEVTINVSEAGYVNITTFTEFAEEINTALNGKASSTDLDEHKNDNTMHVTSKEKASWNGKAELTDIPTTLPADGGNADTLDGLHETSFSRNRDDISDCNNAVLPGTYNAVPETINTPYSDYWLVTVDIGASGTWIRQTATHCNTTVPTETYHRLFINDAWNSWTKINGNADIAKKVETASQKALLWEDSEGGNLHLESPDGNHSVEMDLYNNSFRMVFADNGELAFPVDYNSTTKKFNINGNADTVDGKHASDFALKTDIPTTLPANGGRSDTASHQINHYLGQGIDVLAYATSDNCPYNANTKVRIMHNPTCPTNYGYNAADNDFWYDIYKLDNSWVQIKAYDARGNVEFMNSCINGRWSGWVRSADGGNANTANLAGSFSSTPTNVCLRNLSSGTADVTTTNCPRGAWYGKHS